MVGASPPPTPPGSATACLDAVRRFFDLILATAMDLPFPSQNITYFPDTHLTHFCMSTVTLYNSLKFANFPQTYNT